MDRRRNLMAEIISGGGMEMTDLPLIYKHTLTEAVANFDIPQNTFRCDKHIMIRVVVPKVEKPSGDKPYFSITFHTENYKATYAWENRFIDKAQWVGESPHGVVAFLNAFKPIDGNWVGERLLSTLINDTATNNATKGLPSSAESRQAITGILIGRSAFASNGTLPIGTEIKVWGI